MRFKGFYIVYDNYYRLICLKSFIRRFTRLFLR
nr:MAG TPA: hypothetical protein [Caudoviricetes sp.]